MKTDDSSLPLKEQIHVQKMADLLLKQADAYGRFPTPIKDIADAAKLKVKSMDHLLAPELEAPDSVKKALSKLQGFLDRRDRTIYLQRGLHTKRRKSLTLHEIAHDFLPEQRMLYQILEDSESELDDQTHDLFERSANCFASDVHFQLNSFTSDARDMNFGIVGPVTKLTSRYGAGNYSTLRRYTEHCGHAAALLVCDSNKDDREWLAPRRFVRSSQFKQEIGNLRWPEVFSADSWFVSSRPRNVFALPDIHEIKTVKGQNVRLLIEAFDSTRQVFFLMRPFCLSTQLTAA